MLIVQNIKVEGHLFLHAISKIEKGAKKVKQKARLTGYWVATLNEENMAGQFNDKQKSS